MFSFFTRTKPDTVHVLDDDTRDFLDRMPGTYERFRWSNEDPVNRDPLLELFYKWKKEHAQPEPQPPRRRATPSFKPSKPYNPYQGQDATEEELNERTRKYTERMKTVRAQMEKEQREREQREYSQKWNRSSNARGFTGPEPEPEFDWRKAYRNQQGGFDGHYEEPRYEQPPPPRYEQPPPPRYEQPPPPRFEQQYFQEEAWPQMPPSRPRRSSTPVHMFTKDINCADDAPVKAVVRFVNARSNNDAAGNVQISMDAIAETEDDQPVYLHPDKFSQHVKWPHPDKDGKYYPDIPVCLNLSKKEHQSTDDEAEIAGGRPVYIARNVRMPKTH